MLQNATSIFIPMPVGDILKNIDKMYFQRLKLIRIRVEFLIPVINKNIKPF